MYLWSLLEFQYNSFTYTKESYIEYKCIPNLKYYTASPFKSKIHTEHPDFELLVYWK